MTVGDTIQTFNGAGGAPAVTSVNNQSGDVTVATSSGGFTLVRTGLKTGAYTAAAGDLVPCDTTSGNVPIALPTAPADKSLVCVKHVTRGGTNTVTVTCGGSDTINITAGATSRALTLLGESILVEYQSSTAIWTVVATDLPLTQTDLRYLQLSGGTLAGTVNANNNRIGNVLPFFVTDAGRWLDSLIHPRGSVNAATYTFVIGDQGAAKENAYGAGAVWTVPPQSSVAWDTGVFILVENTTAGSLTIACGAGVLINGASASIAVGGQWSQAILERRGADSWSLFPLLTTTSASATYAPLAGTVNLIDNPGDSLTGTADNTLGKLAKGSAFNVRRMNSAANAEEWVSGGVHLISQTTLVATAASIDLTSIPSGFRHLLIEFQLRTDAGATADFVNIAINTDTTNANYDKVTSTTSSSAAATETLATTLSRAPIAATAATAPSGYFTQGVIDIPDYADTVANKIMIARGVEVRARTSGNIILRQAIVAWNNTAAINQLTFVPATGPNFIIGSKISLYGVG